jgi:hypothetical protein
MLSILDIKDSFKEFGDEIYSISPNGRKLLIGDEGN